MTLYLRRVENNVDWAHPKENGLDWVGAGEIAADPITNIRTRDNSMSVCIVDGSEGNINRVVAALAATRNVFKTFDFVIFYSDLVEAGGIEVTGEAGETPDNEVNSWHRNLEHLTGTSILNLATKVIYDKRTIIGRRIEGRVRDLVIENIQKGVLEKERVNRELVEKIQSS